MLQVTEFRYDFQLVRHTTFMHFRYLQLDIFTLINIIYLKHIIICNSMTLSSTFPHPSPFSHLSALLFYL